MSGPPEDATGGYFRHPHRALAVGVGLLLVFALLAFLVPVDPLELEQRWAQWMHDIETSALTNIALVFNFLGRGIGRALVIGALGAVLLVTRQWIGAIAFAVTEAATPLLSASIKGVVGRPRPPDGLVHPTGSSFPSGHVSFAAATSVAVVLLFTGVGSRRPVWWTLAALATLAMAWSRTYLQVHWLLDVAGGALVGAGIALVVFAAAQLGAPRTRLPAPRVPALRLRAGTGAREAARRTPRRPAGRR